MKTNPLDFAATSIVIAELLVATRLLIILIGLSFRLLACSLENLKKQNKTFVSPNGGNKACRRIDRDSTFVFI